MSKIFKIFTSRLMITLVLIFVQLGILLFSLVYLSNIFVNVSLLFQLMSILLLIFIFNHPMSPSAKLPWVVLIIFFPVLAAVLFFMIVDTKMKKNLVLHNNKIKHQVEKWEIQDEKIFKKVYSENVLVALQSNYIYKMGRHPLQQKTNYKYFDVGEKMFESLITDLKNAKEFIFMEYFIINQGSMWDELVEVLIQKAEEGLDVRLIYDDIGCLGLIPYNTYKQLSKKGVKTIRFNPFKPILSIKHNTRTHRKITSIDGRIGYTGGLNIADEYINRINRFNHWKDTAIRLEGLAVSQLTIMFLETYTYHTKEEIEINRFMKEEHEFKDIENDGFVQVFGDSPINEELIGQSVYMNILNNAKKYVYIFTPYLIVDNEMIFALCLSAKRGVDVRIVLPFTPDKWYVHLESRSYYARLISAGVKIYEYTPGFMHAKSFLCDDEIAIIGTINLDYRSLYHHFENAIYLYNVSIIKDIRDDFNKTLDKSHLVTIDEYKKYPIAKRFLGALLKFFSPLM